MSVTMDQGCVVVEKIDISAAIGILDAAAPPLGDHQWVRSMKRDGARIAAGHDAARRLVQRGGARRAGAVIGYHLRLHVRARARFEDRGNLYPERHFMPPD